MAAKEQQRQREEALPPGQHEPWWREGAPNVDAVGGRNYAIQVIAFFLMALILIWVVYVVESGRGSRREASQDRTPVKEWPHESEAPFHE